MILKIGISGKRKIDEGERDRVKWEISTAISKLLEAHRTIDFVGYTSLAEGADTIFADVVKNEFKKPLQLVLPFDVAEYREDFQNTRALSIFDSYLAECPDPDVATSGIPVNKEERNQGYFNAGKEIADTCNEMLFVWDELKPEGHGGTAEIMGYYAFRKEATNIDYIKVTPVERDKLQEKLLRGYDEADKLAKENKANYKNVWVTSILLGWLVVLCFALKVAFLGKDGHKVEVAELWLTLLEFILVVIVFSTIRHAKAKKYHSAYLKERQKCEKLRVLRGYYAANVEITNSPDVIKTDTYISELADEITNHVKQVHYHSKWFSDFKMRELIDEQLCYHRSKIEKIGDIAGFLEGLNKFVASAFLLNLFFHLLDAFHPFVHLKWINIEYSHNVAKFLALILPATYAAIEGFLYYNEWAMLKSYSESARKSLEKCLDQMPDKMTSIADKECFAIQCTVANLVASVMLTDNKNWNMIFENKEEYKQFI